MTVPDDTGSICAHLRASEEALLQPAVRCDRAHVSALLDEDFVEFGASGRVWTRDQILDKLTTEDYEPPTMEDFECIWIGEEVVLVTYRTVRIDPRSGARSAALRSSLWTKKSGEWLMRFHQGTSVP